MEPLVIRGELPSWTATSINGYGYGYGYGDGDGYGYGDGDGDGYGCGYGSGSGYGYGDGYGDGDGSGYGSGYGYGYGYGDGDGYGYGDGYGCGSGSGSGYGYGDGLQLFAAAKATWSVEQRDRLNTLSAEASVIAFWKSTPTGKSANGGIDIQAAAPGVVHEIAGPLRLCSSGALHATMNPKKWNGDRLWVVALLGEFAQEDDKFGALRREIIGEVPMSPNPEP